LNEKLIVHFLAAQPAHNHSSIVSLEAATDVYDSAALLGSVDGPNGFLSRGLWRKSGQL
jgi:hypothetical protein